MVENSPACGIAPGCFSLRNSAQPGLALQSTIHSSTALTLSPTWSHRLDSNQRAFSGQKIGTSALTILTDLQTSVGRDFRQSPSSILASEQPDALRSEPLFGKPRELLERLIAGVAE